ncbi:MAG: hypothetical protein MJE66_06435 [Proteobacteria bacterium]|nr:hypothetical protein [Pseudomonadota bacterium]
MLELIPNLAGEEGGDWRAHHSQPAVRTVARLWHALFAAGARRCDDVPAPDDLLAALGADPARAAFPWLECGSGRVAWYPHPSLGSGPSPLAPAPDVVARVHDKAFALQVAEREGWVPRPLRGCALVLDPDDLSDASGAVARIQAALDGWPDWTRKKFTLKPRLGSSGRGRVAGRDGVADFPALRGALSRFATVGGALLEPWLDRIDDLSAQLWVSPAREVILLGTSRPWVSPAGLYRGQRGLLDYRGRVVSGHREDESVREAAAGVANAAAQLGFYGPAGLDAFTYRQPDGREPLRAVVEWNARFTVGHVAIGLLRRALPRLRERVGLAPGHYHAFALALDAPADTAPDVERLALGAEGETEAGPALLFAREAAALDEL